MHMGTRRIGATAFARSAWNIQMGTQQTERRQPLVHPTTRQQARKTNTWEFKDRTAHMGSQKLEYQRQMFAQRRHSNNKPTSWELGRVWCTRKTHSHNAKSCLNKIGIQRYVVNVYHIRELTRAINTTLCIVTLRHVCDPMKTNEADTALRRVRIAALPYMCDSFT